MYLRYVYDYTYILRYMRGDIYIPCECEETTAFKRCSALERDADMGGLQ